MQTDIVEAWQVDVGDFVSLGSETAFKVIETMDSGEGISLTLQDEDGEVETFHFTPWESITLVSSFEDEEDATLIAQAFETEDDLD